MNIKIITISLIVASTVVACADFKRMSYAPANRDEWQQPHKVIEVLDIMQGDIIADLGAGGGYFTFHLANSVGPAGKVIALDTDQDMITYLTEQKAKRGYANIEVVKASTTSPGLAEHSVDLVFCSNTFHHFEEPGKYFAQLKSYLRPKGRVVIIDFKNEGWFKRWIGHATSSDAISSALKNAGYVLVNEYDFLSQQHFLVFTPASA